jgi:hypothetical protein
MKKQCYNCGKKAVSKIRITEVMANGLSFSVGYFRPKTTSKVKDVFCCEDCK